MSEEQDYQSNMDAMLDAIHAKNLAQSRNHFDNLMSDKVSDALEMEKVRMAGSIYNHSPEESSEEEGHESSLDVESQGDESDWGDLENEVDAAFEEESVADEVEV